MYVTGLLARAIPAQVMIALCFIVATLLSACGTTDTKQTAVDTPPAPSSPADPPALNENQSAEIRALTKANRALTKRNRALRESNAKLQLKLLEGSAELTRSDDERGEAIQEVVRTKSKLRGIESKAEAASTMAEVEIALRQVKAEAADTMQSPGPGIRKAEQLLAMSAAEFENSNYGGTIYLADQAKSLIGTRREQMGTRNVSLQPDEVPFALPVALEALRRSNVRDGPGHAFEILLTLPPEAPLLGLAYKDEWVRVRVEDGRDGWMHYTLVDNRYSDSR
jgi:hypothetical protein